MIAVYVILVIFCILVGMAVSVYAFGTGSKRSKIFENIYYSIDDIKGKGVVYTKNGEYSAVLKLENPVQQYSADTDSYYDFASLLTSIMGTVGEGYALHKQDIFIRRKFKDESDGNHEFLSESYFRYFTGREYTDCVTYITITQENKKSAVFTYDNKKFEEFLTKAQKVQDLFKDRGCPTRFLTKEELSEYADRYFAQDFTSEHPSFHNLKVEDEYIGLGNRKMKIFSLVDVDSINLPTLIRPYTNIEVNNTSMPVDLVNLVSNIPGVTSCVYNQVVFLPQQKQELSKLEKKKNRHSSLPSPANLIAVEDIGKVQEVIARENKQLVYCHFNILVTIDEGADMQKCVNHLENAFGRIGINISKQAYNQLELFVASFPGNCYTFNKDYDRFLTLTDAAACLMYKERIKHSEDTPCKIYYTDRQGVPVAIDITGKEGAIKYTDNSNFFCLGPSGSGKSFHMNSVVRQLWEQDTDIVMVDTGNSYEGLCEYVGGKYISYTEEHPITMNPFRFEKAEFNVEKVGFLKNLVMLIWKGNGADVKVSKTEDSLIEQVINEYYQAYFEGFERYTESAAASQRRTIRQTLMLDPKNQLLTREQIDAQIQAILTDRELRRAALKVKDLSFNTYFEYSTERLPQIMAENSLHDVDLDSYSYQLSKFYLGGKLERTLNENMDTTLFDETFIVFEIDSIKDDPLLFPLVTLIIMDVFIQKMRIKKNRKCLVIEEAWKAIASPMMAEYIKYLYKTARKFWASVGVVTQEIQDIIGSPIVKEAIINNSDIFMLLDQSKFKERFGEIKTILGLTDVECKKIFTINRLDNKEGRAFFREVFIRRSTNSDVFGVEEPRECYMTYTTERAEKEALKLYKKEMKCSHQKAIEQFVKDWNKSGIGRSLEFARKVNEAGRVLYL